ncbi:MULTISPECIES: short-chain dehydrogenase [Bacillus]|uniref:short-chain dehydrogenase n=1 Tax=Bacillus TaxID=1386 RepID=UPI0001A153F4|nr:short-chain dehydrogenase [Bacillus pseudomycoides]EEM17288.1 Short chain dehydrogenase [Bacillus pseudomycoides DSM 12442]MED1597421.1 short-chain dehydrogenase [Bacillus pseudomycoides]MED4712060.1 short-chain dehydrogenase [Bacillus pseudomycoides]OOR51678.1 short-chain dehydrogenase [Bacillus pseudomycoides]PDY10421.1 short-chain dehydrogenase [Bacillus pseudomycoides]
MHALVIGGTGMLKKVSVWLCNQGLYVSVIGRDRNRLEDVKNTCNAPRNVTCISLDYHDGDALKQSIKDTIKQNGPIRLVVAWVHTTAKKALQVICEEIELHSKSYSLFHILGSSASRLERQKIGSAFCNYHRILLGFILQGEHSRWLTHEEITDGVIAGIQSKQSDCIVGTLEPWELRPI